MIIYPRRIVIIYFKNIKDPNFGEEEWIIVSGNPSDLATAIASIDDNQYTRTKMGNAGRRIAMDRFSWTTVAGDMATLYQSCIDRTECPAFTAAS